MRVANAAPKESLLTGYNNLWSLRPIFFVKVKAVHAVDNKIKGFQGTIVEKACIS